MINKHNACKTAVKNIGLIIKDYEPKYISSIANEFSSAVRVIAAIKGENPPQNR